MPARSPADDLLAGVALACAAVVVVLGIVVARKPPGALDRAGFRLRGHAVPLAFAFTLMGRARPLSGLAALAFGIAMILQAERAVAVLLAAQAISQLANGVLKRVYHRPRPAEYFGVREREFSYPSGHALSGVVFFAGLAVLAAHAVLPPALRAALVFLLLLCAIGIPWSRLALGAHFVSDIAAGMLAGIAWLALLGALGAFGG